MYAKIFTYAAAYNYLSTDSGNLSSEISAVTEELKDVRSQLEQSQQEVGCMYLPVTHPTPYTI